MLPAEDLIHDVPPQIPVVPARPAMREGPRPWGLRAQCSRDRTCLATAPRAWVPPELDQQGHSRNPAPFRERPAQCSRGPRPASRRSRQGRMSSPRSFRASEAEDLLDPWRSTRPPASPLAENWSFADKRGRGVCDPPSRTARMSEVPDTPRKGGGRTTPLANPVSDCRDRPFSRNAPLAIRAIRPFCPFGGQGAQLDPNPPFHAHADPPVGIPEDSKPRRPALAKYSTASSLRVSGMTARALLFRTRTTPLSRRP